MLKEFRDFIMTGNVIDLAVAVILGAALNGVIGSFVADIAMPFVGHFTGGADFSSLKIVLSEAVVDASGAIITPENAINYGKWINTIINLVMVGLVLFAIVKAYNKTKKPVEAAPAGPSEIDLLTEIRDALKK
jgi:large conductance mechanosensitive channel